MQSRQRTWTPLLLTQLLVVLAVLASGITGAGVLRGRDSGGGDVLQVVSRAGSSAAAEKTFRSTFKMEVDGLGLDVTSTGEILVDIVRQVQSGHVQVPGLGTIEMLQVGERLYVKVPGPPRADGKSWYAVTAPAGAAAVGSQDPMTMLSLLGGADDVRTVGEETVNGVVTTRYSVDVDPEQLATLSGQNAAIPAGALDQVEQMTTDLWVDADDLPRRMRMIVKVQQVSVTISVEMLDYGRPVQVTEPATQDVLEVGDQQRLGQLLQGFVRR